MIFVVKLYAKTHPLFKARGQYYKSEYLSANKLNNMHYQARNKVKQTWNEYLRLMAMQKKFKPLEVNTIFYVCYFEDERERDYSNYQAGISKLVDDGIFGARGDSYKNLVPKGIDFEYDPGNPRVEIYVNE